ncbi:SEL1-like repeat protein [Massilia sp. PAMC28688]|uniref:SEL1-like repeat protein n=1 Tax=Massilia sp. PAMC28688 TaxID=2861283 RepID=UPI001C625E30|nr:SEL1-like repeat protein [Massilia sp. PAMC28688]QYF93277.1 SEL1-like repeat protein [Massilia sp. PAMC28688]
MMARLLLMPLALAAALAQAAVPPSFDQGRQLRKSDSARALVLIEAAAKAGHAPAMFILSSMLMAGEGTARDEARARQWLERAVDEDNPEAMQQLAYYLQDGLGGYARDEQHAAQLLRRMAHALRHRAHGH